MQAGSDLSGGLGAPAEESNQQRNQDESRHASKDDAHEKDVCLLTRGIDARLASKLATDLLNPRIIMEEFSLPVIDRLCPYKQRDRKAQGQRDDDPKGDGHGERLTDGVNRHGERSRSESSQGDEK